MRDIHSNIKAVQHLVAANYSTTQTPASGVDRKGFDAVEVLISIGTVPDIDHSPQPSWDFKLQHSDDESSNYEDITDSDLLLVESAKSPVAAPNSSTGVFLTVDAAAEDAELYRVGYLGDKQYLRVIPTANNAPGATPMSITMLLGKPALAPTSDG
jgi:hypothetical protein